MDHSGVYSVLLVEDDAAQAAMTVRQLTRSDHPVFRIDCAESLSEAQSMLGRSKYHALLLDLGLAESAGFETLRLAREIDATIPIIVLTALDDEQTALQSFDHGAQEYLIKGQFDADSLGRCIRYAMQRQWMTTELRRARDRNEHLLRSIPSALIGLDGDDRVMQWNAAAETTFGLVADEAIGRRICDLNLPLTTDALWRTVLDSRISGQTSAGADVEIDFPDGARGKLHCRVAPLIDHLSNHTEALILADDVTQQRRLQERLERTQRLEAIGQLAGGVAHEFNNLLQAIKGYAGLALQSVGDGSQAAQDLNQVIRAADRAATITSQLLRFSRRDIQQRCQVKINATIEPLAKMLRPLLGDDVELCLDLSPDAGSVHADPGMIEQVLMNLCLNSRDAMLDGGKLTIATRTTHVAGDDPDLRANMQPGVYIETSVRDTGCGMPPHVLERLFEPFFTTKEVGKGTGLGLSAVYGMVKQHGGVVRVESEVGGGSTFRVLMPQSAPPTPVVSIASTCKAPFGNGREILFADDDPMLRGIAMRWLNQAGFRVKLARDGAEAAELVAQSPKAFSLALLDVVMPRLTGTQASERIRSAAPDLPIVFCSAYANVPAACQAILRDDETLLEKPYDQSVLLNAVRNAIGDSTSQAGAASHRSGAEPGDQETQFIDEDYSMAECESELPGSRSDFCCVR